jgi:hypothetical protein
MSTDFKSEEARNRFLVYQEGQRAANTGAPCPYTDWRAGTWLKGYEAAEQYWADLNAREQAIRDTLGDAT